MASQVTIVMYHFVRDLERSPYPRIKGLTTAAFREQLEYVRRHYNVVRMEDVMAAAEGETDALPPRALLLTFDDGYLEHYTTVFPLLDSLGMQGSFFPPAKAIAENQVLDVNKIHFVLASIEEPREIVEFIFQELDAARSELGLNSNQDYYARLSGDSRYDSPDVTFIKRILQRELPEEFRSKLIERLFRKYVTQDEAAFSRELYMGVDQLRELVDAGMHVGSHGYDHYWLNTLPPQAQIREVDLSLEFLGTVGVDTSRWVMCYPYGGYNESLVEILGDRNCVVGLATEVAIADLTRHHPLMLPRLDTNDLPKQGLAPANEWTRRALGM